jgi:hypothetical protein
MKDSPTYRATPLASEQLALWGPTPRKQSSVSSKTQAIFRGSTPHTWLIELAMEEDALCLRDAVLIALLGHRGVKRLAVNTFLAQKRLSDSAHFTTEHLMEWIEGSAIETLCQWYYKFDYYELDVLELILDVRFGLVSGD